MKKTKTLIAASLMMFISAAGMAQTTQKDNQLTITGITGQSIKESDANNVGKLIENISNQIIKEKLTANTGNLSYILNSKEFVINGVAQPSDIHLRYKNAYIKNNTKWSICKNYKTK
jgi:hypothetical protein